MSNMSANSGSPFRSEAVNAARPPWLGSIILIRPISFTFLTLIGTIFGLTIVGFITLGTYTKRTTVVGQLLPNTGLVKVYVPQVGIILERRITEGQYVEKGDLLFILSSDRQILHSENTQATISDQVTSRQFSLRDELNKTKELQQEERIALSHKIDSIRAETAKLDTLIVIQKSRVKFAEDTVIRYQGLQDHVARQRRPRSRGRDRAVVSRCCSKPLPCRCAKPCRWPRPRPS